MQVTSLGFATDLALRVLEGAEITDRGDYLVVRIPDNPTFYWGNFLLLAGWPEPGTGNSWLARFAAEFPHAGHIALGVDAGRRARGGTTGIPGRGPEVRARHRAELRRGPVAAAPEHRRRDPAAGLRR